MPRLPALLLATFVAACGSRGPLVLPPGPPPEPLLGNPRPAPAKPAAPATGDADVNTDQKPTAR